MISKRIRLILFLVGISNILTANDGSYYTSGNHLIPMIETRIQVKKEILTLKRVNKDELQVTVYYEFLNPDAEKTMDAGFEAASPSGDVSVNPKNGQHPNIYDFTVNMNDVALPYKVAIVSDSLYYKNGKFIPKTSAEIQKEIESNGNYVDFLYAYHFKAIFRKGINIIKHTYRFKLSSSVDLSYDFYYILTAAKRWGNKQIDDFTLLIDMGELESYKINHDFFRNHWDWHIDGIGFKKDINIIKEEHYGADSATQFDIRTGSIVFKKTNFNPRGELFLYSQSYPGFEIFDYKKDNLLFNVNLHSNEARDELSLKILKNLPYARRGYIFKNAELQAYYEKMEWYLPDSNYVPDSAKLTEKEQEWLKGLVIAKG